MYGMPKGRGCKGGKPPRKRTRSETNPEIRVPFNPMTTCESMNASYTRNLSESVADIHPSNFSSQGSFSDQGFSASPFQCSYFSPAYSSQSYVLPSAASQVECSYRSPLQGQNLTLPSSSLNLLPPPLVPLQPTPTVTNMNTQNISGGMCNNVIVSQTTLEPSNQADLEQRPFNLHFISGNISRCAGCKKKYFKPPKVPDDLCIQHEEWCQLMFPNSSSLSKNFSNAYYHASLFCIKAKWPLFIPNQLIIPPSIYARLLPQHWDLLYSVFGIGKN